MERSALMLAVVLAAFASVVLPGTDAHTMGLGNCPRVQWVRDFDVDKFLGEWYVIQKFATQSSCMKYNFTRGADNKLRVVQTKQHFVLDKIGVDHIYTYTGVLSVPDSSYPARMRVRFPMNLAGDAEFLVYMTDYTQYAGVYTCQKILFGHTKSATILSRTNKLDEAVINQLRQRLQEEGVDPSDFNEVDQSKCIGKDDANLNVKIDDKTFSSGNVAGVVKKIGGAIKSGIGEASDIVGTGIAQAANITSDFLESLGDKSSTAAPEALPANPSSAPSPAQDQKLNELLDAAKPSDNDAEWLP